MKIAIYCKNDDPYSQMLRNMLTINEVLFETKEVSRDKEAFDEMYKLSGQTGTPVLVINGHAYVGFDREMIKEILRKEQEQEENNEQSA